MEFNTIVSLVAVVILIVVLVVIGFSLRKTKDKNWPPVSASCPDYWEIDSSGNCMNSKLLGKCNILKNDNTKDFNSDEYSGTLGPCKKYEWAKGCGISWDGITYGAPNPCLIKK
jgi:hypothetical protein